MCGQHSSSCQIRAQRQHSLSHGLDTNVLLVAVEDKDRVDCWRLALREERQLCPAGNFAPSASARYVARNSRRMYEGALGRAV